MGAKNRLSKGVVSIGNCYKLEEKGNKRKAMGGAEMWESQLGRVEGPILLQKLVEGGDGRQGGAGGRSQR